MHIQHSGNTVGTGSCLGHGDDQVCHFDQLNQDLRHIIVQRNHHALGEDSSINLHRANPNQKHHSQIDDNQGYRIHQHRHTSCGKLLFREVIGHSLEGPDLVLLLAERAQHPHPGEILPGGGGYLIQRPLHLPVHGHGNEHDSKNNQAKHRDHTHKNQRCLNINGKCHNHGAKHDKGGPQEEPQGQIHSVLNLVDICCRPRNHGGSAHGIDLPVA